MKNLNILFIGFCSIVAFNIALNAQAQLEISVDIKNPGATIQPTMWGIFFEDINFAADGGIYAEMIKNRSFEFPEPFMGWQQPNSNRHSFNEQSGMATAIKEGTGSNNHFVRIEVKNYNGYELINEGYRGMGLKEGNRYNLTFMARKAKGISEVNFQLINREGNAIGETRVSLHNEDWKEYQAIIVADKTEAKAKLKITFFENGSIEMDMISLFPEDTWKSRPKGLRKDLVQLLADLKPGFLRFPGGCIVEGRTLDKRYQWKKTVGDIENRELLINRWNTEFSHRSTPDYFQSFGLGFFEYFQLAEDLGAEPLPILSCGMACQFNTGELAPLDELDPFVKDALDLIEFANGPTDSEWGKIRAEMGHPKTFNLKYIGVGNEQWGSDYIDRLKVFTKAIKAKYPEIIIVSGTGPFSDGEYFDYAEKELKKMNAELVDEHYYKPPDWFLKNADRYDSYDRDSYKVFAGEYAAHSRTVSDAYLKNNWNCALSEAAYITGLERNADVVWLTSYAPLFAHVDGWQWSPDLIWFNNLTSYGTPSYYVQKLFSNHAGTNVLSITSNDIPLTGQESIYASSVIDKSSNEIFVKIVNTGAVAKPVVIDLRSQKGIRKDGKWILLHSDDILGVNSIDKPTNIMSSESEIEVKRKKVSLTLPAHSFSIVKVNQGL